MRKLLINQYKRLDIFQCDQEAHRHFNGRVSVYHVLKEKSCYPTGCIYFIWHCSRLEKGIRCIHGFQFVGSKCKGCTYYLEDKIHLQPQLLIDKQTYEKFLEEFEMFENWLENIKFKRINIAGQIKTVKPWFEKILFPGKESHIKLKGYLLVFKSGFIGIDHFKDTFYVRIPEKQMQNFHFVPKMKVEFTGEIREDRGRLIIHRPQRIEIMKKGWGKPWTHNRALVAVKTATFFKEQNEQCLQCHSGALVDVFDRRYAEEKRYRNLFCLKGIQNQNGCYINAMKMIKRLSLFLFFFNSLKYLFI